jgi:hypothetical protein
LFGLAVASISALLFGLIPAIRTARADLAGSLKSRDAAPAGRSRVWGRSLLVSAQVALALVLLSATMFFYRGVSDSVGHGPGSRIDHLAMMNLAPSLQAYDDARMQRFYDRLVEQAAQMSGVTAATLASVVPLKNQVDSDDIVPEGYRFPPGTDRELVLSSRVEEHYFDVLGRPIVKGRGFLRTDTPNAPRVALVNQNLAALLAGAGPRRQALPPGWAEWQVGANRGSSEEHKVLLDRRKTDRFRIFAGAPKPAAADDAYGSIRRRRRQPDPATARGDPRA